MKPWLTDRPDLERRDRVAEVKRRLADMLNVNPYRVDEMLRRAVAIPQPNAKALVVEALQDQRAAGELRRLLFDLLLEPIAELVSVLIDERIADERRSTSESEGSREQEPIDPPTHDAGREGRYTTAGELADQADDFGDAYEGPDLF